MSATRNQPIPLQARIAASELQKLQRRIQGRTVTIVSVEDETSTQLSVPVPEGMKALIVVYKVNR